ncbi:carbohydrate ABC transporter permease [Microbacterium sp. 5K110]|uniref:carbohydrate ABC transporter permease n=1 Tax=unclassified Microbacterium TaxID=2609290 RepID=UPI0010FE9EA2|nr:carbohydrate ABC transporter permease [Microbacterium sp. 5K110]TLF31056.1 carbohydrate ABC transporter permease [Microbacterium sp. 5K110]
MTSTTLITVPAKARRKLHRKNAHPLVGIGAWAVGLLFILPLAWTLLTSLHTETAAATSTPNLFAPLTLENYANVLGFTGGASAFAPLINSAIAALLSTVLVLIFALPAAYATSIKPVKKANDVMSFFLSTKFLPAVAGLLPVYLLAKSLGALDSIGFLAIMYTVMNLPIAVWMLRSFLAEVPIEILEAAELDGANLLASIRHVILSVAAPGIAATSFICIIFSWNELLIARTLTGVFAGTAPVFLAGFVTSQGLFLAQLSAACIVVSLPVLIVGFAAQDRLVAGLSLGAVK